MAELGEVIEASNFILITRVIDKLKLRSLSGVPPDPYQLALGFCLETLQEFMLEKQQDRVFTHVVVERQGKN
ncbi:hypothetical protein [Azohydromonas australica]|uniref:hypothetical protein n=1 Tax=Azohydromonas australica TaxID=364039 RepID=UPI0003F80123|nr:hypothetical protein [Azohydromonas australica]